MAGKFFYCLNTEVTMFSLEFHTEALKKLCCFCGNIVGKPFFLVEKYEDKIQDVFYIEKLDSFCPDAFCKKCYNKMNNVGKRKSTANSYDIFPWIEHADSSCSVCKHFSDIKKGGAKKKIAIRTGRPAANAQPIWDRKLSTELDEKTPPDIIPKDLNKKDLDSSINPQLSLSLCSICDELYRRPISLTICSHQFCFKCILKKFEGRNIDSLSCPKCFIEIRSPTAVTSSSIGIKISSSLQLGCAKGCSSRFTLIELKNKSAHEKCCKGEEKCFKLVDILNIPLGSTMPKDAEKAAAHVIRSKMKNSTLPNKGVRLNTGSSRVSKTLNSKSSLP